MGNLSGTVAALSTIFRPRILIPTIRVSDIRALDWVKMKGAGINAVVLDKDNCLTKPLRDELIPDLKESWDQCLETFGTSRVLVVSNSAGTIDDPSLIQAEAVSRSLEVPVLIHGSKKPSPRCAMDVARYFSPRQKDASYPPVPVVFSPRHRSAEARWDSGRTKERETGRVKVLVVGDRLTTDIILASRLTKILSPPPSLLSRLLKSKGKAKQSEGEENEVTVVSVLTDRIWARERLGTRTMRWMEERMLRYAMWVEGRGGDASALKRRRREWEDCVRSTSLPSSPAPSSTPSPGTWLRGLSTSRLDIPRSLSSSFARFVQERLRRAVEEGRRWYDGGLGCGVRRPEGVRRLESWKRM